MGNSLGPIGAVALAVRDALVEKAQDELQLNKVAAEKESVVDLPQPTSVCRKNAWISKPQVDSHSWFLKQLQALGRPKARAPPNDHAHEQWQT